MLAVLIPAAIVLPIVLYPVSYTAWQALDIAMRPVTVDDFELVELLDEPSDRPDGGPDGGPDGRAPDDSPEGSGQP